VGQNPKYETEWYQPLTRGRGVFGSVSGFAERYTNQLNFGDEIADEFRLSRLSSAGELGYTLGTVGEFRAGVVRSYTHASGDRRTFGSGKLSIDNAGYRIKLSSDVLDNPNFPKRGWAFSSEWFQSDKRIGADLKYHSFQGATGWVGTRDRHTLSFAFRGATDFGSHMPPFNYYSLGGLLNLSGYRPNSLIGRYLGFGRTVYYYRLSSGKSVYTEGVYLGLSLEAGNVWVRRDDVSMNKLKFSSALTLGIDTIVGPLYIAYARPGKDPGVFYVNLGRVF
jgi:NTE family protein